MKFLSIYKYKPEQAKDANSRYLESGGKPPEGIKIVGRWHDIGGGRGFTVIETDDPVALSKWSTEWDDLLSLEIVPVIDDQEAAAVMGS
ncbi:MAG: DUF3303 domain-containing protein [Shimia sp.]|nr:DUF3303 domain-containing protein [Shimia sp.]